MLRCHVLVSACGLDTVACKGNLINLLNLLWWVDSGQCLSPPQVLACSSTAILGREAKGQKWGKALWETKKAVMLCKHCWVTAQSLVYYQPCCSHISKRQHHSGCFEGNSLHCNYTQYILSLKVSNFSYFIAHRVGGEYLFFKELSTCINPSS